MINLYILKKCQFLSDKLESLFLSSTLNFVQFEIFFHPFVVKGNKTCQIIATVIFPSHTDDSIMASHDTLSWRNLLMVIILPSEMFTKYGNTPSVLLPQFYDVGFPSR